jgi:hypothetical protein
MADPIPASLTTVPFYDYPIEQGEGLDELVTRFGVTREDLVEANRENQPQLAEHPDILLKGKLHIPMGEDGGAMPELVTLKPGQSLKDLAAQEHVKPSVLQFANRHELNTPDKLPKDGTLWVPGKKPATGVPVEPKPVVVAEETPPPAVESKPDEAADPQSQENPQATSATPPSASLPVPIIVPGGPAPTLKLQSAAPTAESPTAAKPPVTGTFSANEYFSDSASATVLRASVKIPLSSPGSSLTLSGANFFKAPDVGLPTSVTRFGVDLGKPVIKTETVSVNAAMGMNGWVYENIRDSGPGKDGKPGPQAGYDKFLMLPTGDVTTSVKLMGGALELRNKSGAWAAVDAVNKTRSVVPYTQFGAAVTVGGLTVSDDVRAQLEIKHNAPDPGYFINIAEVGLNLTDNISTNVKWTHTFNGGAVKPTTDFPQGERNENKFSFGFTLKFPNLF